MPIKPLPEKTWNLRQKRDCRWVLLIRLAVLGFPTRGVSLRKACSFRWVRARFLGIERMPTRKSSSFDAYRIIVVQNSKWKRFKDWVLVSLSMKLFISVDFRWWLQYISMKAAFVASIKYHVSAMLRGSHPTMSLDEIHGQIRWGSELFGPLNSIIKQIFFQWSSRWKMPWTRTPSKEIGVKGFIPHNKETDSGKNWFQNSEKIYAQTKNLPICFKLRKLVYLQAFLQEILQSSLIAFPRTPACRAGTLAVWLHHKSQTTKMLGHLILFQILPFPRRKLNMFAWGRSRLCAIIWQLIYSWNYLLRFIIRKVIQDGKWGRHPRSSPQSAIFWRKVQSPKHSRSVQSQNAVNITIMIMVGITTARNIVTMGKLATCKSLSFVLTSILITSPLMVATATFGEKAGCAKHKAAPRPAKTSNQSRALSYSREIMTYLPDCPWLCDFPRIMADLQRCVSTRKECALNKAQRKFSRIRIRNSINSSSNW